MKPVKLLLIGVLGVCVQQGVRAQSLPVGSGALEDYYRRLQLQGETDPQVSFTVRPVFPGAIDPQADVFYPDSVRQGNKQVRATGEWLRRLGELQGRLLPVTVQTQYNSDHPYGWNDGALIPARGFQTLLSAGVYARYGPLSIQLRPEAVLAANQDFENFNKDHYDIIFARYYDIYNNIDLPVQFGQGAYNKLYWGQSSIRLSYKWLSAGVSTENLWWGPGIRSSLLLSNTSPGFGHLTLNTVRPVQTGIGTFEGQLIGGRLHNSGYAPLIPDHSYFGRDLYEPKPSQGRYLSGIILTWQPKWIRGLFLGFDQSSQLYEKDQEGIKDYLPFFSTIKKVSAPDEQLNKSDQRSEVFMRWVWTQEHAEIYFEWGHNNYTADLGQSLLSPDDSRGYVFGIRKQVPVNTVSRESIQISAEVTQLQETNIARIKAGEEWYVSKSIRQGYTNRGEALGAGIGPGGNLQSLDVSWIRGLQRIGLQVERYIHNNDFYYYAYADSYDFRRHWVDLSVAASGEWSYGKMLFNAKLEGIKSINYQWYLKQNPGDPYFVNGANAFNLQVQLGASYRF